MFKVKLQGEVDGDVLPRLIARCKNILPDFYILYSRNCIEIHFEYIPDPERDYLVEDLQSIFHSCIPA